MYLQIGFQALLSETIVRITNRENEKFVIYLWSFSK